MAGIIAGSVAGWSPIERTNHDGEDVIGFSRGNARAELDARDDIETHPGTNPQDPIITEDPRNLSAPPSQVENVTAATSSEANPPQAPPETDSKEFS